MMWQNKRRKLRTGTQAPADLSFRLPRASGSDFTPRFFSRSLFPYSISHHAVKALSLQVSGHVRLTLLSSSLCSFS